MAKRMNERRSTTVVVALLLAVIVAAVTPLPSVAAPNTWKVKLTTVPDRDSLGTKADLEVHREFVEFRFPFHAVLKISAGDLVEVAYDNVSWSRSEDFESLRGSDFVGLAGLMAMGIAAPFRAKDHFIFIYSSQNEERRPIVFEAAKNNFREILDALAKVTGEAWVDRPADRETAREEIRQAAEAAVSLTLDRPATLGKVDLPAGDYWLAIIEREANRSDLLLFDEGRAAPKNMMLYITAEPTGRTSRNESAGFDYGGNGALAPPQIETIHLSGRVFRPRSVHLPIFSERAPLSFYGGDGWWAPIRSIQDSATQWSTCFPAAHRHQLGRADKLQCAGMLCVTADDVSFQPQFARGRQGFIQNIRPHSFTLLRSQVAAQKAAHEPGKRILEIDTPERDFDFLVVTEKGIQRRAAKKIRRWDAAARTWELFWRAVENPLAVRSELEARNAVLPEQ